MAPTEDELLSLLSRHSKGRIERFNPGQWDAISALFRGRGPLLLVERTGWGKSLVYFAATHVFRRQGAGPTLLISPLLSLMRDQILAATALGLRAATINSANESDWDSVFAAIDADQIDLLLVSPERLAREDFVLERLLPLMRRLALFVIDEAHCLSDWGHDFRPDYRRIRRLVARHLPNDAVLLATTATANDRVIADLSAELGMLRVIRGPLARKSLRLQTVRLPGLAHRYAWIAERLAEIPGSGIVYAATRAECDRLALWLQSQNIVAYSYHAGITGGTTRAELEEGLRTNRIKALVATSALGMGFDKPDLAFVIHHQAPASPVHYYQQIGRAGRALDAAYAVLLGGPEDEAIVGHFIDHAVPDARLMRIVLDAVEDAETGLSDTALAQATGLEPDELEPALKLLASEEVPPIRFERGLWHPTFADYRPDVARQREVEQRRRAEWGRMKAYAAERTECLMRFLVRELDDKAETGCGHCANCLGHAVLPARPGLVTVMRARRWLSGRTDWRDRRNIARASSPAWLAALKALFRIG